MDSAQASLALTVAAAAVVAVAPVPSGTAAADPTVAGTFAAGSEALSAVAAIVAVDPVACASEPRRQQQVLALEHFLAFSAAVAD